MAAPFLVTENTLALSGSEQTIWEAEGQNALFSLNIEVEGALLGYTHIRTYQKMISTGGWILVDDTEVLDIATEPGYVGVFLAAVHGLRYTIEAEDGPLYSCDWSVFRIG
jgi:hypothetical protein